MFTSSTTRLLRTARPIAARRFIHPTPAALGTAPGRDPQLSQGLTGPKSASKNRSPEDVQSDYAESGYQARNADAPHDVASDTPMSAGSRPTRGNPEQIGMREQVGGANASAQDDARTAGEKGGQEEASAPGYVGKLKQALGMSGSSDIKRDDRRALHTSAVARATSGVRADPAAARAPKESGLRGEQNEHLKHKKDGQPDSGKGNAAAEPTLPSQKMPQTRANAPSSKRSLHTSAGVRTLATVMGNPGADPEQQSVGEVREASTGATPVSASAQDGSGAITLAELEARRTGQVQSARFPPPTRRPRHSYGTGSASGRGELHTSALVRAAQKHDADSYFKDVDTAPSEAGGVHKVDSSNEALDQPDQSGHTSGPYHKAGIGSDDYQSVSKNAPYNEPGADRKENLRYGGTPKLGSERSGGNPQPKGEESPQERNKGGRGPESN